MAPRPSWKGYLKLSLVSCAVALYPATTTSERVTFRTLNRATGNRVRRQFVDEASGEPVESEDQVKGYEVAKNEYITMEDDELKSVQLESTHTIDIERFVPRAQINELYFDTPYYLAPTDRVGEEAFAVIREAMRAEKMVGIARVVLFRRERLLMLEPRGKGLVGVSLHYANEVQPGERLLRGDPGHRHSGGDARSRQAHHQEDDRQVRSRRVRGSLRECLDRADPLQAEGHADQAAADAPAGQRHQPDGCPAPQRRRRQGRACQEVFLDDDRQGEGKDARPQDRLS